MIVWRKWIALAAFFVYLGSSYGGALLHELQASPRCECKPLSSDGHSLSTQSPKGHDLDRHGHDCGVCRVLSHGKDFVWAPVLRLSLAGESEQMEIPSPRFFLLCILEHPSLRGPPVLLV